MVGVPFDTRSPDWEKICQFLETELLQTYRELARLDLSEAKTQQLRGRAAYISKLLGLGKSPTGTSAQNNFEE